MGHWGGSDGYAGVSPSGGGSDGYAGDYHASCFKSAQPDTSSTPRKLCMVASSKGRGAEEQRGRGERTRHIELSSAPLHPCSSACPHLTFLGWQTTSRSWGNPLRTRRWLSMSNCRDWALVLTCAERSRSSVRVASPREVEVSQNTYGKC
ncbi:MULTISPECIES: hypothetical protein [Nostoc]|uniref:Uncharacterized protein n=1 Tax=Nostoc paludosum FACHB-159 TaxID=2692908 RepID=A0ABR8KFZ3_9NOSO|nr:MULTISPECIES: hypothetical protein [Nostoc]MBD2681174.1 hypothetical protein [Nostoc sp. FACHB-857]MBD2737649.1 hypothetical protein [Nostoc paludosum FACHB-159]